MEQENAQPDDGEVGSPKPKPNKIVGTLLGVFGFALIIIGGAIGIAYGENSNLAGLFFFLFVIGGLVVTIIGGRMIRPNRQPSFRGGSPAPDAKSARPMPAPPPVIAKPAHSGPGSPTADNRSRWCFDNPRFAGAIITIAGLIAASAVVWYFATYGSEDLSGWVVIAVFACGGLVVGPVMIFVSPRSLPPGEVFEARHSTRFGGCLMIGGTAALLLALLALAVGGFQMTDDTVGVVFFFLIPVGIGGLAFGKRLTSDRRIVLRADDRGLYWTKTGVIPWEDVLNASILLGYRRVSLVLTLREPDGAAIPVSIDLGSLDRDTNDLKIALEKWGVPVETVES